MRKRWFMVLLVAATTFSQTAVPTVEATVVSLGEMSVERQEVTELRVVEEEVFTGAATQKNNGHCRGYS